MELKIDKDQKKQVTELLKKCKLYKQVGFHPGIQPAVISRYGADRQPEYERTDSVAAANASVEQERRQLVEAVTAAVEKLGKEERMIIEKRHFAKEKPSIVALCMEMGLGNSNFHRIQHQAYAKLAMMFGIANF